MTITLEYAITPSAEPVCVREFDDHTEKGQARLAVTALVLGLQDQWKKQLAVGQLKEVDSSFASVSSMHNIIGIYKYYYLAKVGFVGPSTANLSYIELKVDVDLKSTVYVSSFTLTSIFQISEMVVIVASDTKLLGVKSLCFSAS